MGPLLLLLVIFHCFCQTAVGQQEQHEGKEQQEQELQGQAVQESGYYLASVNNSDKIGDSEQTWKKQKIKNRSICAGPYLTST